MMNVPAEVMAQYTKMNEEYWTMEAKYDALRTAALAVVEAREAAQAPYTAETLEEADAVAAVRIGSVFAAIDALRAALEGV